MSRVDNTLSDVFGVVPMGIPEKEPMPEPPEAQPGEIEDFEFVRQKLHALLHDGSEAFTSLAAIAAAEEKISAFTAMNEMMNNLSDIALKLLEIQERKAKLENIKTPAKNPSQLTGPVNNNTAVFVGSTKDLAGMLSNMNFPIIDQDENPTNS